MRLLNWPIQRRQHLLPVEQRPRIAIHTAAPSASSGTGKSRRNSRAPDRDLQFVRELFPSSKGGPTVVCVSSSAWQAGIRPGMPLAEARSMATPLQSRHPKSPQRHKPSRHKAEPETLFLEWAPADDRSQLLQITESVRRFAPVIGIDESPVPDSLLLDITGCGPLFGGESSLAEQLYRKVTGDGWECQISISDTVASAWAFAHPTGHFLNNNVDRRIQNRKASSHDAPIVIIPPAQTEHWLNRLPVTAARIPLADSELLLQLGVIRLQQLLGLPMDDLPARLSAEAITRIRQLRGTEAETITPIPEANPVSATWVSEFPATNRNELQQVLAHLTEDIQNQLHQRLVGAVKVTCLLKHEDGSHTEFATELVKAVQSGKELLDVLKLRLETLKASRPAFAATMTAEVSPLPIARQQDLFDTSEHIQPAEELAAVVNRLSNRLGRESVVTVHSTPNPVPEHEIRIQPMMEAGTSPASMENKLQDLVSGEISADDRTTAASRPLTLLPMPMMIAGKNQNPLRDGFTWQGSVHEVCSFTGPERLQTQWWHDTAVHRDYYRVQTTTGGQLWIFRNLTTGEWKLHGVFD